MVEDQIDTGLSDLVYENPETLSLAKQITATVNPDQGVAQPGRAAGLEPAGRGIEASHPDHLPVPAVPLPAGFGVNQLAQLARHIATDMHEIEEVLTVFKLTPEQYKFIETIPFYKNALDSALIEWNSPMSTNKRIAIKAAAAFEDGMIPLAGRMTKADEPYPAQIECAKLFAKVAGIGEQKAGDLSSEKFTITINLGNDQPIRIEKDVTPKLGNDVPQTTEKLEV